MPECKRPFPDESNMNKIICLLLLLPAVVQAQFNYITSGGNIIITGYTGDGGEVVVPDMTNGLPVTAIAGSAFEGKTSITSMTLGTNMTSIGAAAFRWCYGLTNVTLGTSLASVSEYAFYGCSSLGSIAVPASLTSIGSRAFSCINTYASSLAAINVATNNSAYCSVDGVLFNKGTNTLIQCPSGKAGTYAIPGSVTTIGYAAFAYCIYLTHVTIPNSVTGFWNVTYTKNTGRNTK